MALLDGVKDTSELNLQGLIGCHSTLARYSEADTQTDVDSTNAEEPGAGSEILNIRRRIANPIDG